MTKLHNLIKIIKDNKKTTFFVLLTFFTIFFYSEKYEDPICEDCNVIIVGFDALQAAHVSSLGYQISTTPEFDKLSLEGTTFNQAIAPASWTVPSFMSIFTGLFPSEHKVVNKFSVFTKEKQTLTDLSLVSPQVQTLAEVFKSNDYVTGGFTGDAGVGHQFGYNKGFDIYTDEIPFGSISNSANHATEWINKNKNKKMFIFLHGYDDHGQYALPKDYKGRFVSKNYKGNYKGTPEEQKTLRELGLKNGEIYLSQDDVTFWRSWYDSKIRDTDDRFANFWNEYDKLGLKNKTIVVMLSDHGTEFYEHKRFDHGFSLYDELIHVPLSFIVPGLKTKGIIKDQVTTLDVAPTLIELTGINASKQYLSQIRGKSLLSYLQNGSGTPVSEVYMETDYRDYTHKRGLRTSDGWKYILTMENGKEELYNLISDPKELHNIVAQNNERVAEYKKKIYDHITSMKSNVNGPWNIGCVPVYGDQCKK